MSELFDPTSRSPDHPDAHKDIALDITALMHSDIPARETSNPSQVPIKFPTGSLTLDQLIAIFSTMPVDLTFIDADDRVRFLSEGPERVFIRPRSILGRKVQRCHPQKSIGAVEEILSAFKAGTRTVADFWLTFEGKFVLVRYFALRDHEDKYMGTLEVTQNLTRERQLTGERRLLDGALSD